MDILKSSLTVDGSSIRFSLPISKVDVDRRIVSGFATTDAVDKQGDIVTSEASLKAFKNFRNNLREMHQPLAVGKVVSFKEDKYFDPESKKFYSGVFVSAYISKGAQNTWEKVLDGTLSGFSIGGKMNKWDDGYDSKSDSKIRIIKDYDLVELSLVDNPANQFANIMSIEKNDSGEIFVKGDGTDTILENVFWDKQSGVVLLSENESEASPISGEQMENIGFVEKTDNEKTEMIKFLVDSARGIVAETNKEVSPMTENTEAVVEDTVVEKSEEVAPEADTSTEDVVKADEVKDSTAKGYKKSENGMEDSEEEEEMDKADDMKEEEEDEKSYKDKMSNSTDPKDEAEEVSKSDDVVTAITEIKDGISSAFSDISDVVKSLRDEVTSVTGQIAELKKSLGLVSAKLEDAESEFNEFGKRVDAVEADTAFRKSGDLGEIVQDQPYKVEKSLWGGRFLKTADLLR